MYSLHLLRKFLKGCCYGNFNFKNKWSAQHVKQISATVKTYNPYMPKEIHRSISGLDCLYFWKGNEYCTFLYYLGIVLLKDNLSMETYSHFIVCIILRCSSEHYLKYLHWLSWRIIPRICWKIYWLTRYWLYRQQHSQLDTRYRRRKTIWMSN